MRKNVAGYRSPSAVDTKIQAWKSDKPKNAGMAGKGAPIAVIIEVIIYVIAAIMGISLFTAFL